MKWFLHISHPSNISCFHFFPPYFKLQAWFIFTLWFIRAGNALGTVVSLVTASVPRALSLEWLPYECFAVLIKLRLIVNPTSRRRKNNTCSTLPRLAQSLAETGYPFWVKTCQGSFPVSKICNFDQPKECQGTWFHTPSPFRSPYNAVYPILTPMAWLQLNKKCPIITCNQIPSIMCQNVSTKKQWNMTLLPRRQGLNAPSGPFPPHREM